MNTFLWHDYETWGINPALDKPSQFAAIRTDEQLNVVGDPLMLYCQPANDCLPNPMACMVTGISPQKALNEGVPEAQFIQTIHQQMMQSNTCSVGFNSIRFDDEVTRFALYRNFYDAYEREWKNGNSRFDLIDVVRMCAAIRPEGIQWPTNDDGLPVFKLERLTEANGIEQKGAHDALVDVKATIDMARLVRDKQPKLWEYALTMRNKQEVAKKIDLGSGKPVLHISGMFGNKHLATSVVLPLAQHPSNKNAIICIDLRESPEDFIQLSVDEIKRRVFSSQSALGDTPRIALKNIHLNKCPMVLPISMLNDEVAARVNLDKAALRKHYDALRIDQTLGEKAQAVFKEQKMKPITDPEAALYSGGFFSDSDKAMMSSVRKAEADQLASQTFHFEDDRLGQLLFRYKARNFPDTLTEEEVNLWQQWRFERLTDPNAGASITLEQYQQELEALFEEHQNDERKQQILSELMDWGDMLLG